MVEYASWEQLNGTVLGQYHLQQLLEQHQWGPIFLATDSSNQTYSVRFLGMPGSAEQSELSHEHRLVYLGRFQQAANQISGVRHERILPLLDYGAHQGTPYLIYPYQKLTALRAMLKSVPSIDLVTVGRFLEQIAEGLSYAHERGVLHRNLSTLSIFVRSDRRLIVGELGLLHIRELYKQYFPATTGALFDGNTEASAPEQWVNKPIDVYADTYALGAVLYRLLTRHAPFEGNTREEAMEMHLSGAPTALNIWRADLPPGLDAVMAKALAKEPLQRFQKPEELVLAYWQIAAPNEAARLRSTLAVRARTQRTVPGVELQAAAAPWPRPPVPSEPLPPAARKSSRDTSSQPSRRRLFTLLAVGGVGAVALVGALEMGLLNKSTSQNKKVSAATTGGEKAQGQVLAHVADIPVNSSRTFAIKGHQNPGIIVHLPDNRFVAFDTTCTHQGCAVSYNPPDHQLLCPCHGASFDPANNAAVTGGPAPTPLTPVKISVNADGTITM
ncbi:MAG TPA: protein kinase [Ktedonobacteraceae bacterium]|jgi:serine/threonine protein kinase/nitrite reductase/ring-hydroxylating ferredoxin subunit|nr:protein kinase [Ktedonobacteraceae bacterium]